MATVNSWIGYGWVEKFRMSISRSNLLWVTIPALVWYAPGCVLPHPLPSPTLVPLWRPPSYSSNHRDGDSMECNPSARIMHAECLYSWLWSSGFSSTSSPNTLVTTGRYQPVQLYTCNNYTDNLLDIQLESTYKCINQLDELSHAFSIVLDKTATTLYCGLN